MAKGDQLNQRERKLLEGVSKGKTFAQAAIEAGYSERSASQCGYQAWKKIKEKMPEILDRKGLTDESVIDKYVLRALDAEQTVVGFTKLGTQREKVEAWSP